MRFAAVLALAGAAWLGGGCVMIDAVGGNEVPEEHVREIVPGQTTRAQVLDWFGSPAAYTDPSGLRILLQEAEVAPEDVLSFPYADVLVFQLTRAKARGLLIPLFFYYLDARGASDRLVVFFDDRDRVMYYGYRKGTDAFD